MATLCAVRLLDALPPALHPTLSCIGFAVPPVGNAALASLAQAHSWQQRITNYLLPEDWVPGLLSLFHRHLAGSASMDASASLDGSASLTSASFDGGEGEGGEGASGGTAPSGGRPHEWVCWGHAPSSCGGQRGGAGAAWHGAAAAAAAAAAA